MGMDVDETRSDHHASRIDFNAASFGDSRCNRSNQTVQNGHIHLAARGSHSVEYNAVADHNVIGPPLG
jgi:hypothetical protein